MKISFFQFVGVICVSFIYACGTTGHIKLYSYNISKDSLENVINLFFINHPEYTLPENDTIWKRYKLKDKEITFTREEGNNLKYKEVELSRFEFLVYFKERPEEINLVKYYGNMTYWKEHPHNSILALTGSADKGKDWRFNSYNLWFREKNRIEKRFENEFLSKLKVPYSKLSK